MLPLEILTGLFKAIFAVVGILEILGTLEGSTLG
jgi:hypothetical protein